MPNIKSAKKRVQKSEKTRLLNRQQKSKIRTYEKKIRSFVEEGITEGLDVLFAQYVSTVDRTVKKNILHRNTANRKKSQLSLLVKKVKGELAPSTTVLQGSESI